MVELKEYKGYKSTVEFNDGMFRGEISPMFRFEAFNKYDTQLAFEHTVDRHIKFCQSKVILNENKN